MAKKRAFLVNAEWLALLASKCKVSQGPEGQLVISQEIARRLEDEELSRDVYARRLPELMALDATKLVEVNVSVREVVVKVLSAVPKLNALRPLLEATFRVFDFNEFDGLEDYAFTLSYTDILLSGVSRTPRCPPELEREAHALQRKLRKDCRALAERELVDGSRLRNVRRGRGFQLLASNLLILSDVLRDSWPRVAGRCATKPEELKRASELADQLLRIAGQRDLQPEAVMRAMEMRARAFTLLMHAYQRARRAAAWVLDSDEIVDVLAPKLSSKRQRGREPGHQNEPSSTGTEQATIKSTPSI